MRLVIIFPRNYLLIGLQMRIVITITRNYLKIGECHDVFLLHCCKNVTLYGFGTAYERGDSYRFLTAWAGRRGVLTR
jgi:hypothetical protein